MSNKAYRENILKAVEGGSSVFVGDVQYTSANIDELPSEAELAVGNPDAEAEVEQSVEAEIARLVGIKAQISQRREQAKSLKTAKTAEAVLTDTELNYQAVKEADAANPAANQDAVKGSAADKEKAFQDAEKGEEKNLETKEIATKENKK